FGRLSYELTLVELRPGEGVVPDDYRIEAFAVEHGLSAKRDALVWEAGPGRFDLEEARRLGVPEGPLFGRLQGGEAVELPYGGSVNAERLLGPARAGRKVVLAGDTRAAGSVLEAAKDADVLVHEATFSVGERRRAEETLHAPATSAAELALAAGVRLLALTHLSTRYFGPEIVREARTVFPQTVVPKDFDIIDVRFPERGGPRLVKGGALGRHEEGEPHDKDGSGDPGERPRGGRGDSDDPALRGNPVGARVGRRDASDGARQRDA